MRTRMPQDIFGLLEWLKLEDVRQTEEEIGARCPMHLKRTGEYENRTDHWFLNLSTGAHHCFSCGYKGNLTTLVMDVGKLDLWEALRKIAEFGIDLQSLTELPPYEREAPLARSSTEVQMHSFVDPSPAALAGRHISTTSAASYGLRWDKQRFAWVLPIVGPEGALWGYQTKQEKGAVLNHPRKIHKSHTLFGLNTFAGNRAILVESPLDVVYIHEMGFHHQALSSFGSAVSDVQLRLILERADELILALDNDPSGIAATQSIISARWHRRIPIQVFNYRTVMKGHKDPGEMGPDEFKRGLTESTLAMFWSAA